METMNEYIPFLVLYIALFIIIEKRFLHFSIFSPWAITNAVWLMINLGLMFYGNLLLPLKGSFCLSIFLWILGFNVFSLLTYNLVNHHNHYHREWVVNYRVFYLLFIIAVIFTPIYLFKVYHTVGNLSDGAFADLRQEAVFGHHDYGFISRVQLFDQALLILAMINLKRVNKWVLGVLILFNIFISLSIAEKGSILFLLIVIAYVLYKQKYIKVKHLVIVALCIVLLFWGMNVMRSKTGGTSLDSFLMLYVLSPSVGFDELKVSINGLFGENTFPAFYKLCNTLFGTNYEVIPKMKDYTFVPFMVNVYTIMQPFYQDWGYMGVLFFSCIFGTITGFYYKKSYGNSIVMKCTYVFLVYILVTQFFQDNFFISISEFFQFTIIFLVSSKIVEKDVPGICITNSGNRNCLSAQMDILVSPKNSCIERT